MPPPYVQGERSALSRELSNLTTSECKTKPLLGMIPATGSGSDVHIGAAAGSRVLLAHQYHAEGGLTDGCYALYNGTADSVGLMDDVLAQIKVWRTGGREEEG